MQVHGELHYEKAPDPSDCRARSQVCPGSAAEVISAMLAEACINLYGLRPETAKAGETSTA